MTLSGTISQNVETNNNNLLNAQKGSGVARNEAFHKHEEKQEDIFSQILSSPDNFDINGWIKDFSNFAKNYKKLLYAKISSKIISCSDNSIIENLTNNISTVIEAIKPKEKGKTAEESIILVDKDCYTLFLKFHDHCNLAMTQRDVYLRTEEDFKKIAETTKSEVRESLKNATKEINKHTQESEDKINSLEKNITGQLISLVSIFTALSFVIFGGISVLGSLLENIKTLPLLNIVFVADLWMLCMINLFVIFVKLIIKLTNAKDVNLDFYKKVNYILVACLIIIMIIFIWNQHKLGFPKII